MVDFNNLKEDDRVDLEYQISKLIKKIKLEFTKLFKEIHKAFVNSEEINRDQLVVTLTNEEPLFEQADLDLKKTVHDILLIVKSRCSYFNYEVLQKLIEVHGSDQDNALLEKYNQAFTEYCKAVPCTESVDYGNGSESTTKLGFKVDDKLKELKQGDIKSIQHKIADHLDIKPSLITVYRVTKGCVLLEFLVPNFIIEKIFPLTDSQIVALYSEDKVLTIESKAFKLVRPSFINYAMHCMSMAVIIMIINVQDIQSRASRLLQASRLQTTDSGKLCTYFATSSPMTML